MPDYSTFWKRNRSGAADAFSHSRQMNRELEQEIVEPVVAQRERSGSGHVVNVERAKIEVYKSIKERNGVGEISILRQIEQ